MPPRSAARDTARAPTEPRLPASLGVATIGDHDLCDEATYRGLEFSLDLSGRSAEAAEFDRCRLRGTDLAGTALVRAVFTDCLIGNGNVANLRAEKSSMARVRLDVLRMTGLQWIDGSLRDVTVARCRADLASFRFTRLHTVTFTGCNLSRADFQNAELNGVRFVDCDLSGAQFSQARTVGTRFVGCDLSGIGGATSLAGAVVATGDLATLAYTLAAALGITIEDGA